MQISAFNLNNTYSAKAKPAFGDIVEAKTENHASLIEVLEGGKAVKGKYNGKDYVLTGPEFNTYNQILEEGAMKKQEAFENVVTDNSIPLTNQEQYAKFNLYLIGLDLSKADKLTVKKLAHRACRVADLKD